MCRRFSVAVAAAMTLLASSAFAADQVYFSSNTNVTNILVQYINQENVRLDISSWYLSEHAISIAIVNRFKAGVKVRIIGDRGAIFEADPNTKREYYFLANEGVPIRLRFNPTWFPEIDHWKAAIFVGQNVVEFGSGNFAPTELAPVDAHNYCDDSELFTSDPALVAAFKSKFDQMWNDTTVEPGARFGGPPYLKSWPDACTAEPTGNCNDFSTQYPNAKPMVIDTSRLEPNASTPAGLYWGQGDQFNLPLISEINNEHTKVDVVAYRMEVDNLTNALLAKFQAGVPVRIIIDPGQYTNNAWPEYWLTHANIDKLWAAGVPIRQRNHAGVTHLKTVITSNYATNASSNFAQNWQRDHNYFVPKATKTAVYNAFVSQFNSMWNNTTDFGPLVTTPPQAGTPQTPASGAGGVATTTALVWGRGAWAVSYDVYLGTSSSNMTKVANVPAQLVQDPPATYSYTPSGLQAATTYFWKVVSLTNATPKNSAMQATSSIFSFTTAGGSGGGGTLSPYSGSPAPIPGQIAAEKFDNGGEGVAYHDSDPGNNGGQFRTTGVDIEASGEGGFDVGWIASGEWLKYTVNVATAGNYNVTFRVASPGGASFHAALNGTSVAVSVPATGGWQNWTSVTVPITLSAGTQVMTLTFDTGGMNLRYASFATSGGPPPPPPPPPPTATNVVIYASDIPASGRHGAWATAADSTAAGNLAMITPDSGVANTANALASPADYVDVSFNAQAGTPYTFWIRLKATANSKSNDAVWVQFSDAQSGGAGIYPMNTTSGLLVNLATDSTGSSLQNWGWANGAYWLSQPATVTFPATGTHTLRIQVREDGVSFDQIVLSPGTYLSAAPGPPTNDNHIVPKP